MIHFSASRETIDESGESDGIRETATGFHGDHEVPCFGRVGIRGKLVDEAVVVGERRDERGFGGDERV